MLKYSLLPCQILLLKFIPIYVGPLWHVRLLETFNINFIVQAYPEIISGRVNHKALRTEKYSRYINIFFYFYYIIINWKDTLHGFLRNETTFFSLNFKWKIVKKCRVISFLSLDWVTEYWNGSTYSDILEKLARTKLWQNWLKYKNTVKPRYNLYITNSSV